MAHDSYQSPLEGRYASKKMKFLFSDQFKFSTWRRLWLALAKAEKQLGLDITDEQLAQMSEHLDDINFDVALEREKLVRHDVMSHVYAFGEQCPAAKPIIHLGATSCYVGDNTDIITMYKALGIIEERLVSVIARMGEFALKYKDVATLGFTHFQPAQPTTVGKRATLWINDLLSDLCDLRFVRSTLRPLGSKGTTGTQASFLELFEGDEKKCFELDSIIARDLGFDECVAVSGQTYSRKQDARVLGVLSGIAQSCSKFANDLRLLAHMKEIEEPFESNQIGSSAMPYKRNPMRAERICSLARYIITDALNPALTESTQWLERTLDDSANRRIAISEGFLACDAILMLYENISSGLVVNEKVIERDLARELPFMASETILMDAVKRGLDRQEIHERIRVHSVAAANAIKQDGAENDLFERIAADPAFGISKDEIIRLCAPEKFIGLSIRQTERFIEERVVPVTDNFEFTGEESEIFV